MQLTGESRTLELPSNSDSLSVVEKMIEFNHPDFHINYFYRKIPVLYKTCTLSLYSVSVIPIDLRTLSSDG